MLRVADSEPEAVVACFSTKKFKLSRSIRCCKVTLHSEVGHTESIGASCLPRNSVVDELVVVAILAVELNGRNFKYNIIAGICLTHAVLNLNGTGKSLADR